MAQSKLNPNLIVIGAIGLGALFFISRFQKNKPFQAPSGLISGVTGEFIPAAKQSTIRTDIRQTGKTARKEAGVSKVEARQTGKTARTESRTERVAIRRGGSESISEATQSVPIQEVQTSQARSISTAAKVGSVLSRVVSAGSPIGSRIFSNISSRIIARRT